MFLVKICLYFYLCGIIISLLTKKSIEESIPLVFIIDGIIISIFSYFNNVHLGIIFSIYIIPIICFVYIIYLLIIKKILINDISSKISLKNICIFLLFAYAYLLCRNTYFSLSDEYNFWGIRVFGMLKNNSLITQSTITSSNAYKKYPLFFSSIQCLFCYFGNGYKEPLLYVANVSFCFSLFMYFIPKIKIKIPFDYIKLLIFLILIILIGICVSPHAANSLYDSIYIDYPMAIFAAFVLYLTYSLNTKNISDIIVLVLSAIGLLMSKQICLLFICLAIILSFCTFIKYKNKKIIFLIIIILILISFFGLMKAIGPAPFSLMINSITNQDAWERKVGLLFLEYLFKNPTSPGLIPLPYFYYLITTCATFTIINHFNKNLTLHKKNIKLITILFVGGIIWIFAQLYFAYLLTLSEITPDRINIPSYNRYMGTYLFMLINILFMISFDNLSSYQNKLSFLLPLSILLCINIKALPDLLPSNEATGIITDPKTLKVINILDNIPENNSILIVEQYSNSYSNDRYIQYYHYIYDLNKTFSIRRFGKKDYPRQSSLDYSLEEYQNYIANFDYLYVLFADDQYINKYWEPFTNENLFIESLYKIIKDENTNKVDVQFIETYEYN